MSAHKTPRLIIEFKTMEQLVKFAVQANEDYMFGQEIGVRRTDPLDDKRTVDFIVRSVADASEHPGCVLPFPEREEDQTVEEYRSGLNKHQIEALNILGLGVAQ